MRQIQPFFAENWLIKQEKAPFFCQLIQNSVESIVQHPESILHHTALEGALHGHGRAMGVTSLWASTPKIQLISYGTRSFYPNLGHNDAPNGLFCAFMFQKLAKI